MEESDILNKRKTAVLKHKINTRNMLGLGNSIQLDVEHLFVGNSIFYLYMVSPKRKPSDLARGYHIRDHIILDLTRPDQTRPKSMFSPKNTFSPKKKHVFTKKQVFTKKNHIFTKKHVFTTKKS